MQDIAAIATMGIFAFCLGASFLTSREQARLFKAMHARHFQAWLKLGAPGPYGQGVGTPATLNSPATVFIMRRAYLAIPDADLHVLGERARQMALASAWGFGALAVSVLLLVMSN